MLGYSLLASPTLYPGQVVRARLVADSENQSAVTCRLCIRVYEGEQLDLRYGPETQLAANQDAVLTWRIENTDGAPIAAIGVEITGEGGASGTVFLDYLTWDGTPDVTFKRPAGGGKLWQRAWVAGVDQFTFGRESTYRLVQNEGNGLAIQGTAEWHDYRVGAPIRPHMAERAGIAARVQGMQRFYALLVCHDGYARLVKALDGEHILGEVAYPWELDRTYHLELQVAGNEIVGSIDGAEQFRVTDTQTPLLSGAVAMLVTEGRVDIDDVVVTA